MQRDSRWLALMCLFCSACGTAPTPLSFIPEGIGSNEGQLKLTLRSRVLDIASLRVDLSQDSNVVGSQTLAVGTQPLPGDPNHAVGMGGDALFLLASGNYGVTATVLGNDGNSLPSCAPMKQNHVKVSAGQTTEIQLIVHCESVNPGLLDTAVVVETAPVLTAFTVTPNKFPCAGQDTHIAAKFEQPDGDEVTVTAEVSSAPWKSHAKLDVQSDGINFVSDTPGEYVLQISGQAPLGTMTSQMITVHVQSGEGAQCSSGDANPPSQPSDPNAPAPNESGTPSPSDPNVAQ